MAIVTTDNKHYKAIADKVREIKGTEETMLPSEMPEKVQSVYDAGYEKGIAQGGDSWYDTFWDNYQMNGTRKWYVSAFSGIDRTSEGAYWTDENFDPKYGFEGMTYCVAMFQWSRITDLAGKLKRKELKFDTSQCPALLQMFQGTNVLDIPVIDASNSTNNNYFLANSPKTVSVEKFISSEITAYGNTTFSAPSLKHIIFDGVIAQSITIGNSPLLDEESVQSLIDTLMTIADGVARTITLHATVKGKLTDEQKATITQTKGWTLA